MSDDVIVVVGIGADGWRGLTEDARAAILGADEVIGSARQLELLPSDAPPRHAWPSPLDPLLDELAEREHGRVCVLASGDPMLHGIGATLARRLGPERIAVLASPSAFSLACARLGWPAAEVDLVSAVGRPPEVIARVLQPRRRVIVYVTGADGAAQAARVLCERGYGPSRFVVLAQLGAEDEYASESTAASWGARHADPLHLVAIECAVAPGARVHPLIPGLPDDAFESDGALTKRHVRAATLAALAPTPRTLLWDVGAGSGSVAIEWLRAEASARAIAIERREDRAERIRRNAATLGVPSLEVVIGGAPGALDGLDAPDAVFIGGGLTAPGLLARCWDALRPGGRIVANAVTLEGEHVLVAALAEHGGELARIEVAHAEPIGAFTGWRAQRPVVQWSCAREPA
jgi:precorrin-6Y C5,15-methyltransferase (decarboxylating)